MYLKAIVPGLCMMPKCNRGSTKRDAHKKITDTVSFSCLLRWARLVAM